MRAGAFQSIAIVSLIRSASRPASPSALPRAPQRGVARAALAACACLSSFLSPGARADGPDPQPDPDVAGVVVTATRVPSRVDSLVADVTVIDRAQLAASAGLSLAQVLARQPGVQLSTNGGLGKSSTLFLRGGQARHTLVLVDGVRFGSATSGSPSLENFPLEAIERIEIVRGPMAALHGSDAVSGVIQIFTRRGHEGSQLEGSVAVGSEEYRRVTAAWSGGSADWQGALTLSDQATQGVSATNPWVGSGFHPDRDGFRQQSVQASLMHQLVRDWRLRWQGVLSVGENEIDDGNPARNRGLNTRSEVRSSVNSFSLSGRILPQWRSEWRAGHAYDSSNTTVAQLASRLGRFATTQRQLSWENQVALPLGSALVALDHVEQSVVSTTRYPVRHRTLNGLVLGWSGESGPHAWQLSTRHDHNSQYGDQPTAAAAYGYEVSPGWRVGASWGSTFSAPTFNDLYFPGRESNPNMPPQEGITKELSLTHTRADARWRAAFHRNDVRGYIQSSATQVLSIAEVRIQGVSVSADQAWDAAWGRWQLNGSADWLDAVDVVTGKSLRRRANGVFQGELSLQQGAWRHALGATVRDGAFDDDTNTAAKRLGGIGLLHASTRWQLAPEWALALRVDNLTDRRYQTAWGYNQARRQWFLTLSHSPRQGL